METFEKLMNEFTEIQLSNSEMNRIRGGDGPTPPPENPPDPTGGK